MPDIQSELSKVLKAWEEPTTMTTTTNKRVTTNSTRRTFNFVRDNPGLDRASIIQALEADGIPQSSSRSLLSTFVINGNVRETHGLLYANQQEYSPLKRRADEAPEPKPAVAPVVAPVVADPAPLVSILDTLTVKQARALYDELKVIFGG